MTLLTKSDAVIWLDDHEEWIPTAWSAFEIERDAKRGWDVVFEQDALLTLLEWVAARGMVS